MLSEHGRNLAEVILKSNVFYCDMRSSYKNSILDKIVRLCSRAGLDDLIEPRNRVAIKIHWGEPGNLAFIRPPIIRQMVEIINKTGASPFVTDTNTLYSGGRHNAICNLQSAAGNGFTAQTLGAPILVADGLVGLDYQKVKVPQPLQLKEVKIAAAIEQADFLLVISHFKGHMLYGFGGALKHLCMGCAPSPAKKQLHSDFKPKIDQKKCEGCDICLENCPCQAIYHPSEQNHPQINMKKCIGCGECLVLCPVRAIPIKWKTNIEPLFKKSADFIKALLSIKKGKTFFLNFITQVTPDCDCCSWSDLPIVPDIGIFASQDPLALDAACLEMVNRAPVYPGSALEEKIGKENLTSFKGDKFQKITGINHQPFFQYLQHHQVGSIDYELKKVE